MRRVIVVTLSLVLFVACGITSNRVPGPSHGGRSVGGGGQSRSRTAP